MAPRTLRHLTAGGGGSSIAPYLSAIPRFTSPSVRQQTSLFTHSQAPRSAPRLSVLEIERKFAPTTTSIRQLDKNTGEPPFNSVMHKHVSCFEDTYYDNPNDTLSNVGVWLRCRKNPHDVSWEAKIRMGGDFINSAFKEITDVQEISTMLNNLVPGAELDAQHGPRGGQIQELARFVTNRTRYVVDGKFNVVIDVTDFGHTIGEVELERDASEVSCEGEGEGEDRTLTIAAMDKEVGDFMRGFIWAFPSGNPVGKLTAYFDHMAHQRLGGRR
ncbi:CYTH-like domain-containing protein [Diaporthe sp. PMI_573]|nr:CYTH-like domain-containing protein [Diaporthaceae sp. PMI_573]